MSIVPHPRVRAGRRIVDDHRIDAAGFRPPAVCPGDGFRQGSCGCAGRSRWTGESHAGEPARGGEGGAHRAVSGQEGLRAGVGDTGAVHGGDGAAAITASVGGFDRTALPIARAAAICPVKMASGKFQGADAGPGPGRARRRRWRGRRNSAGNRRPQRSSATGVGQGFSRLAVEDGEEFPSMGLIGVGHGVEGVAACCPGSAVQGVAASRARVTWVASAQRTWPTMSRGRPGSSAAFLARLHPSLSILGQMEGAAAVHRPPSAVGRRGRRRGCRASGDGQVPALGIGAFGLEEVSRPLREGSGPESGVAKRIGGGGSGWTFPSTIWFDKGGIGLRFKKAALYEIGPKIGRGPGGVDPVAGAFGRHGRARAGSRPCRAGAGIPMGRDRQTFGHLFQHRRHRLGVVGGELGIEAVREAQELARAVR